MNKISIINSTLNQNGVVRSINAILIGVMNEVYISKII